MNELDLSTQRHVSSGLSWIRIRYIRCGNCGIEMNLIVRNTDYRVIITRAVVSTGKLKITKYYFQFVQAQYLPFV